MLKAVLCIPPFAIFVGLAFYETKLQNQLIDDAEPREAVTEISSGELSRRFRRARILTNLPHQAKAKLRTVAILELVFFVVLVVEVLAL